MSAAVRLEDVRVVIGGRLLLDVPRLTIEPGERVAIVGPNGAGKSTLLRLIGALIETHQGRVEVLGRRLGPGGDMADRRALRRDTGLLLQGLHLVPRLTARENVLIGGLARLRGAQAVRSWCRWYPQDLAAEADDALAALGLADRGGTRADRLSGGERQKVALARLQLQCPRLLLADEPTSALDPSATRTVCHALCAVAAAPGRTLLTVVHDLELLALLATRVVGMAEGRVRWDRPPGELTPGLLQALYERHAAGKTPASPSEPAPAIRLASA
jgi:phosphonate transport system ATP-binding protein